MKPKRTFKAVSSLIAQFPAEKIAAQIKVYKEPHHKIIFRNEYVRLIDLTLQSNDITLEHTHDVASVVVFLTHSKVAIKDSGKAPVVTEVVPGLTVFRNYGEKPVLHTVWIEDSNVFRCLVIEFMHDEPLLATSVDLTNALIKLLWVQKLVDAFSVHMNKGQHLKLPKSGCAYLLVCSSGKVGIECSAEKQSLEAGGYAFFAPDEEVEFHVVEGKFAECVLLKLK